MCLDVFLCAFQVDVTFLMGRFFFVCCFSKRTVFCFLGFLFVSCGSEVNIVFFLVSIVCFMLFGGQCCSFLLCCLFFVFLFRANYVMSYVAVYSIFHRQKL